MCSISGCIILNNPNRTVQELTQIKNKIIKIILNAEDRGRDSFGVTTLNSQGELNHYKKPGRPSQHISYLQSISITPETKIIINNNRAEPTTEFVAKKTAQDIQPFFSCPYIVAHNGTIANDIELTKKYSFTPATHIDSAVIPHLLAHKKPQALFQHKAILNELLGSFALAYTNRNYPDTLYLAANYTPLFIQYDQNLHTIFFTSLAEYFGENSLLTKTKIQQITPYTVNQIDTNGKITTHSLLPDHNKKALIVHSGGMDSTVAAAVMKDQGYDITLLHFQYSCRAQTKEEIAVKNIAEEWGCGTIFVATDIFKDIIKGSALTSTGPLYEGHISKHSGAEYGNEWVPCRNLIMLSIAAGIAESHGYDTLVLGANLEESNSHPDNTQSFINNFAATLPFSVQHNKSIIIKTPVSNLMKHEIVALGTSLKAPLHLTWSCYEAGDLHCGKCGPCYMRKNAFKMNNLPEVIKYLND